MENCKINGKSLTQELRLHFSFWLGHEVATAGHSLPPHTKWEQLSSFFTS
jgi:hypothetical protein